MARFLEHLQQDHQRFDALLTFLDSVVRDIECGEAIDYTELAELMANLRPGLSGSHCAEEGVIWDRLAEQTGSPRLVVEVLNHLHKSVADKGATLETTALAAHDGYDIAMEEIKRLAQAFIAEFRKQIALEERAIFPLVNGVLQEDDWSAIEQMVRTSIDHGISERSGH